MSFRIEVKAVYNYNMIVVLMTRRRSCYTARLITIILRKAKKLAKLLQMFKKATNPSGLSHCRIRVFGTIEDAQSLL